MNLLLTLLADHRAGDAVEVTVARGNGRRTLDVILDARLPDAP